MAGQLRRSLSWLLLGGVVAAGIYAWGQGWFERGLPTEVFVAPPPPPPPDPQAEAARQREEAARRHQDDRRAVLVAMRAAERTPDRERRCLAMPDPPGNAWPAGAAAARCALLRKPVLTLAVMRELLARGSPEPLRRFHAELLTAHYEDPARREQIFLSYRLFDESPLAARVAADWLRAMPRDPYAQAAAGWQATSAAAAARGSDAAANTPEENFAAMRRHAERAWPLLDAAIAAEPRLLPACVAAAKLARLTGERERETAAQKQCEQADPVSYHVLYEAAQSAHPRWGGSLPALEAVSARARAGQDKNPALASLGALPQIAIAETAPPAQAAAQWADALTPAPAPSWALREAADALLASDPWEALMLRSQALRFDPCGDPCHRRERLALLATVADWSWAQSEAQALLADAPLDGELLRLVWQAREAQVIEALAARGGGWTAPESAALWISPMEGCLAAIADRRDDEAKACSEQFVKDRPDNPYTWYVRVRYLQALRQPGAEAALRRMEATVDRENPEQVVLLDQTRGSLGIRARPPRLIGPR